MPMTNSKLIVLCALLLSAAVTVATQTKTIIGHFDSVFARATSDGLTLGSGAVSVKVGDTQVGVFGPKGLTTGSGASLNTMRLPGSMYVTGALGIQTTYAINNVAGAGQSCVGDDPTGNTCAALTVTSGTGVGARFAQEGALATGTQPNVVLVANGAESFYAPSPSDMNNVISILSIPNAHVGGFHSFLFYGQNQNGDPVFVVDGFGNFWYRGVAHACATSLSISIKGVPSCS